MRHVGISKVLATVWYAELLVGLQMLVSMVYWMCTLNHLEPPAKRIFLIFDYSYSRLWLG